MTEPLHTPCETAGVGVTYQGQDLEALADIPNYQEWIVRSFRAHVRGRVLEVGAGIGSIARLYAGLATEAVLLDPAPNLGPLLREATRGLPNVRVVNALLEDVVGTTRDGCDFSPGSFDVVVLINVLEHVVDDEAMLRALRTLLRPGGTLVVFVPALPWLFGSLDELVDHKRRYRASGLGALVRQVGFDVKTLHYFDVFGVVPWLLAGRVLRARAFSANAAKFYDRFVVPVGAAVEQVIEPPAGKNVICIARVPE